MPSVAVSSSRQLLSGRAGSGSTLGAIENTGFNSRENTLTCPYRSIPEATIQLPADIYIAIYVVSSRVMVGGGVGLNVQVGESSLDG